MGRISIAGILAAVAVIAIGLAALVKATEVWALIVVTLLMGMLFASILGVILRGWRGGGWLGFALFGWGYFLLGCIPALGMVEDQRRLSNTLAGWIFEVANAPPADLPSATIIGMTGLQRNDHFAAKRQYDRKSQNALLIGHWLMILTFAEPGLSLVSS